jgi:hypothetical protein
MTLLVRLLLRLLADVGRSTWLLFKPRQAIAAENLILRQQIALFERPHMRLGPGIPDPPEPRTLQTTPTRSQHRLDAAARLLVKSVLGGLHHEYDLAPVGL